MVVCHQKKCIFIHIPKCAGTSIEQFIKDHGRNDLQFIGLYQNRSLHHLTAIELKIIIKEQIFHHYYKFSVVRNPYDRLLSEYYWTPIQNIGYKTGGTKKLFWNM